LLIGVELILRLHLATTTDKGFFSVYHPQCLPDTECNYLLNPDYQKVSHNRQGFRAAGEYDRSSDGARIICVGGSTTYGSNNADNATYPARLEELTGIETINAGIPGHHTAHFLKRLPGFFEYNPDYLVLYCGHNDIVNFLSVGKEWRPGSTQIGSVIYQPGKKQLIADVVRKIKRYSIMGQHFFELVIRAIRSQQDQERREAEPPIVDLATLKGLTLDDAVIDNFRSACESIIAACSDRQIRVILVKQIYYLDPDNIDDEWEEHQANGMDKYHNSAYYDYMIPRYLQQTYQVMDELQKRFPDTVITVDFSTPFYQAVPFSSRNDYFLDPIHLTDKTDLMLAEAIAGVITKDEN